MSEPKKITLRVQCSEGTTRVDMKSDDTTTALFERVHAALGLATFAFTLHRDRQRRDELLSSKSRTLQDCGLRHGDMLYLAPINGAVLLPAADDANQQNNNTPGVPLEPVASTSAAAAPPSIERTRSKVDIQEDEVDLLLYPLSGNIQRPRDEKLCRHNANGSCVHCAPLEPWDENYLKELNIKHMSFHTYLRKITTGNKFVSLDEISLDIKQGCTEHPPWPRGVCSRCQPPPLTLLRQVYRHVDNIEFAQAAAAERFLAYWRATQCQRAGLLLGVYEPHHAVPLGIRARVEAIYEPPQVCTRDSITLLDDPRRPLVEQLAARLGLRPVGWLFSDLLPAGPGQTAQTRGADTHFLSAQECIMAAHFQNQHPNPCRYSRSGYYGSKFVTVCVTGDSNNQVHMEGYQVSAQCQALQRAGALLPTRDAPDLAHVAPANTAARPLPHVYYKERDAYGNETSVLARTIPVAYLLVDVPCGAAAAGGGRFSAASAFPPANRELHEHRQTLAKLHKHIEESESFLEAMSDFHVLLYLCTNEALPLTLEQLDPLLSALRAGDSEAALRWRREPQPATLEQLAAASQPQASLGSVESMWTCALCTFHNAGGVSCEMCAMPRNSGM